MGIYIKGMEMPKKCICCPLSHWNKLDELTGCELHQKYIPNAEKEFWEKDRPDWCPLVKVPPHGRLIDADAFNAEQRHLYCENCAKRKGMKNGKMKFVYDIGDAPCRSCGYGDVLDDIDAAPTIIGVEGE